MTVQETAPAARATFAGRWWDTLLAAVSLTLLLLLTLAAHNLIPGWNPRADPRHARYDSLSALRIIDSQAVQVDTKGSIVRATGPAPYIVVEAPPTRFRVSSVEMRIRPALNMGGRTFAMSFVPSRASGGQYLPASAASVTAVEANQPLPPGVGYALDRQFWIVNWTLPESARAWRVDLPADANFRLESFEVWNARGVQTTLAAAPWMMPVSAGATLALLLCVWQWFGRRVTPAPRTIKAVLILGLAVSLLIITFVLPPFQGPDENAHWKLGLMFYRSNIAEEPAAYYLEETLETGYISFYPEVKFKPQRLRLETSRSEQDSTGMAASHTFLRAQYPYVRLISYPVLFVMSLLFPRVDTVPAALQFFYLCRLLPALLLVALLYALNRKYEVPYTTWFFFSLPLVTQQFVVISADTLLNVGAVVAVLLFLKLRERPNLPLTVVLWLLCLAITYSKFIVGGVLLLPLLLVPYRRLPRPRLLLILAVILIAPVVYVLGGAVIATIRTLGHDMNRAAEVDQQLGFIRTTVGLKTMFTAVTRYATQGLSVAAWSGPLAWFDARISPRQLSLITASGLLALCLDVWAYGPQLVRLGRTRLAETALLAGVAVGCLAIATVMDGIIYYVIASPVAGHAIAGMQMRHLFAAAIVVVLMPLAVLSPVGQDVERSRARPAMIAGSVALVLLPMLLLSRNIELAFDLFVRYWG